MRDYEGSWQPFYSMIEREAPDADPHVIDDLCGCTKSEIMSVVRGIVRASKAGTLPDMYKKKVTA